MLLRIACRDEMFPWNVQADCMLIYAVGVKHMPSNKVTEQIAIKLLYIELMKSINSATYCIPRTAWTLHMSRSDKRPRDCGIHNMFCLVFRDQSANSNY